MSARIDTLAEGLISVLSEKERERLGALLAVDLVAAAEKALLHIEALEEKTDPHNPSWSMEHSALDEALDAAGVNR